MQLNLLLVQQLVIGVLANSPGGSPQHWRCHLVYSLSIERYPLAVTFHGELLQEVGKMLKSLRVGQDYVCLGVQIARIPELEKRHHHRHVLCALGCPRVFIHRLSASEETRKRGPTNT